MECFFPVYILNRRTAELHIFNTNISPLCTALDARPITSRSDRDELPVGHCRRMFGSHADSRVSVHLRSAVEEVLLPR